MKVTQGANPNQLPAPGVFDPTQPTQLTQLPVEPTTSSVAGAEGPAPVQGAVEVPVTTPDAGVGALAPELVAGQAVTSAEVSTDTAATGQVLSDINASPDVPQAGVPPAAESSIGGQAAEPAHPTVVATEAMKTDDLGALEGVVEGKPVVAPQENEQDLAGIVTADTTGSAARAKTAAPPVIEATPSTALVAAPTPAPEPIVAADQAVSPTILPQDAPEVGATTPDRIIKDEFLPSVAAAPDAPPAPVAVQEPAPLPPLTPEPVAPSVEQQGNVIDFAPYLEAREKEREASREADQAFTKVLGAIGQNNTNEVGKDIAA